MAYPAPLSACYLPSADAVLISSEAAETASLARPIGICGSLVVGPAEWAGQLP